MIACRFNELTRLPLTRRRPLWCSTCGVVVPDGLEDLNAHLVAAAQRTADEWRADRHDMTPGFAIAE